MKLRATLAVSCIAALGGLSCASQQPTAQLQNARERYVEAQASPAQEFTPDALYEAQKALDEAEAAHEDAPGSFREKALAYVAVRKAQLAMAKGGIAHSNATAESAQQRLGQYQEQTLAEMKAEYTETKQAQQQTAQQLKQTQEQLDAVREARKKAEEQARRAEQSLREVAKVKAEARGTVITLDGAVLFATGESKLLPIAKQKLNRVAETILDMGDVPTLRVEGHTDSEGDAAMNMELSRQRAQSVAEHLATRGIKRSKIEVVGRGESEPIASNDTPEGRANNRRVEIVVGNERGSSAGWNRGASPAQSQAQR